MKASVLPLRYILLWLMFMALLPANAQQLVMPAALRPGDTIAIVSPSSTPDTLTVEKGCQTLREWGYVPVVAPHALSNWHGFAGTADERAADMLWALRDSTVKAIICSRGGDGAVQVLRRIPLSEFRSHPKWVMGFSDATALHSAEVAAGVVARRDAFISSAGTSAEPIRRGRGHTGGRQHVCVLRTGRFGV